MSERNNHKVGFVVFDLNGFKAANDNYGHAFGDEVLIMVSDIFKSIQRSEEIVFRIGGDEFMLVVPIILERSTLDKIVERYTNSINGSFEIGSIVYKISISAGYSVYPDDGDDFDKVFAKADSMMYENKKMFN
jgi:diguanylate cyclase (GGDEF)-like protein